MIKDIERFQRDHFHGDNIYLAKFPVGRVSILIPEECIDRQRGKINMQKFKQYLDSQKDIFMEYDV